MSQVNFLPKPVLGFCQQRAALRAEEPLSATHGRSLDPFESNDHSISQCCRICQNKLGIILIPPRFTDNVVSQTATDSRGSWDEYIAKAHYTFYLQVDSLGWGLTQRQRGEAVRESVPLHQKKQKTGKYRWRQERKKESVRGEEEGRCSRRH